MAPRRPPRTPWQRLIVAAHDRPLVLVDGTECRLLGCTPTGEATVLRSGRHVRVPASTVRLLPRTPRQENPR